MVQEYARKNHSPMDTITSDSYSIPRQEWNGEPAKNGCYMDGLWIENAYIDDKERTLTECRPNEKWSPMSMLLFQAVPKLGIDHKDKLLPLAINRAGCSGAHTTNKKLFPSNSKVCVCSLHGSRLFTAVSTTS